VPAAGFYILGLGYTVLAAADVLTLGGASALLKGGIKVVTKLPSLLKGGGNWLKGLPGAFSKVAPASAKQLQKKFKHAADFGVQGNFSKVNAQKYNQAIQKHLNAPGTKEISGSYRGNSAIFHTDPRSGLTVIQNPNGSFLSGWKLNSGQL